MKEYKKPIVSTMFIQTCGILCDFSSVYNQKTYNCPIKPQIRCNEYNAHMQEWKKAVEYAAANKLNRRFMYLSDDRMSCPRKTCSIFLEWQKQQKTK